MQGASGIARRCTSSSPCRASPSRSMIPATSSRRRVATALTSRSTSTTATCLAERAAVPWWFVWLGGGVSVHRGGGSFSRRG
eukprot:7138737-Prymnesium_polylepis.1